MLRSVAMDAIVSFHMGTGVARHEGSPSPAADFWGAAAGVYRRVCSALQDALRLMESTGEVFLSHGLLFLDP